MQKLDMGECDKIHSVGLRKQYQDHVKSGRAGYESEVCESEQAYHTASLRATPYLALRGTGGPACDFLWGFAQKSFSRM